MGSNAAEPYSEMEGHFVACIQESLSLYLYENAQFLGERLVAAFPKQVNQYFLFNTLQLCPLHFRSIF